MRILLGQLGANGDCLYATALARQVRHDYPDAELTWAISAPCRHLLVNNPHVDKVLTIDMPARDRQPAAWAALEREALAGSLSGRYERVILSQIAPANFHRYDGTIRPSIMRAYGAPITVPITPVLRLTPEEIGGVETFSARHGLAGHKHRILIECAALSGQSYMTPTFALDLARQLVARLPDVCVLLSSHLPVDTGGSPVIIDASSLSMRQTAALTHHCSLFIGAGSGLTVVTTSDAAARLPSLILLNGATAMYASFHHDLTYWGEDTGHLIEMADVGIDQVMACVLTMAEGRQAEAKARFHWEAPVHFDFYLSQLDQFLLRHGRFADAADAITLAANRYGWHEALLSFARARILPNLNNDPALWFKERSIAAEVFRTHVDDGSCLPSAAPPPPSTIVTADIVAAQEKVQHQLASNHWHQMQMSVRQLMLTGRQAAMSLKTQGPLDSLADAEFRVFSQWGEDGIIEWLAQNLPFRSHSFIEFGVEDYRESNTRFLMQNRNWRGLVLDGSERNIARIRQEQFSWRHDLKTATCFITKDNINEVIRAHGFAGTVGILSIDIDGNDYWIWSVIDCVDADVVICEYNAIFGDRHPVSTPYAPTFNRFDHHHSGLHAGASLPALERLAASRGYALIGTNSAGLNAFFVRQELLPILAPVLRRHVSWPSLFRNSCGPDGKLTHAGGLDRMRLIENLPLVRTDDGAETTLKALNPIYSDSWLQKITTSSPQ